MPPHQSQIPTAPAFVPPWTIGVGVIALTLVAVLFAYHLLVRALGKSLKRRDAFTRSLILRTRAPVRFALLVGALSWSLRVAPLGDGPERTAQHILLLAFMVLVGWTVMVAVDIGMALYLRRHRTDVPDNLQARKLLTQARILRRFLNVLVLGVTAALCLMTIPGVKQLGVSLLAAGGAAGIIVGLALQPVLSNLMAGIQIAFTQPIRIDDAVVVQGEFGHVEEIKSTYVVVRLSDLRRLIVPLKYFLDQPFQNWTLQSSELRAEVLLVVDQRLPLDQAREAIEASVRAARSWDGHKLEVQLNDVREKSMELRVRAGAPNAAAASDLKAEIRERFMGWLQREHPALVPRNGAEAPEPTSPAPSRAPADSAGTAASGAPRPVRPN